MKSFISLFNRPFIFRQTLLPPDSSSDSSSELWLSAIKRSTQPSGRDSGCIRVLSIGTMRFVGFFGTALSDVCREPGVGRDEDEEGGIVGTDWYPPTLNDDPE